MPRTVAYDNETSQVVASDSVPVWNTDDLVEHRIMPLPGWVTSPLIWHHLHLQIRKKNVITGERTKLEHGDKCAIVDFPVSSIFKRTEVFFNHYLVSQRSSAQMYHYYLRAKLEFPPQTRDFLSWAALWCPDAPNQFDSFDGVENEGYMLRHTPFLDDNVVELYAPLMMDIFRQSQPFPDDVDIRIRMELNDVRLCINGSPPPYHTYELGIIKSELHVTRHHPITRYRIGDTLAFPTKTVETKHFIVPQGPANLAVDVNNGPFPDVLTVLMLTQEAIQGAFERSAFNFITNNVKRAQLVVDNTTVLPPDGYQMGTATLGDPKSADAVSFPVRYIKAYVENLHALAPHASLLEAQACIAYNAFVGGSFVLSWRLHHPDAMRGHGSVRFTAELHQPLATTTVLLFLLHYERTIISRANGDIDVR